MLEKRIQLYLHRSETITFTIARVSQNILSLAYFEKVIEIIKTFFIVNLQRIPLLPKHTFCKAEKSPFYM